MRNFNFKILVSKFRNYQTFSVLTLLESSSILTSNRRSLTVMILHLKPKVVNVLAKTWLIKTNLQ